MNDIQYAVTNAKVKLFADDTNLCSCTESHLVNLKTLQITLNQLTNWMVVKNMLQYIWSKNKTIKEIKLFVNNVTIKNVNCSKYLGVMIDNKLTWQYHIDYVYNKLLKFISIFTKLGIKLTPMY